jgi:hypothetical protein
MTDERLQQLRKYYDMYLCEQLLTLAVRLHKIVQGRVQEITDNLRPESSPGAENLKAEARAAEQRDGSATGSARGSRPRRRSRR